MNKFATALDANGCDTRINVTYSLIVFWHRTRLSIYIAIQGRERIAAPWFGCDRISRPLLSFIVHEISFLVRLAGSTFAKRLLFKDGKYKLHGRCRSASFRWNCNLLSIKMIDPKAAVGRKREFYLVYTVSRIVRIWIFVKENLGSSGSAFGKTKVFGISLLRFEITSWFYFRASRIRTTQFAYSLSFNRSFRF